MNTYFEYYLCRFNKTKTKIELNTWFFMVFSLKLIIFVHNCAIRTWWPVNSYLNHFFPQNSLSLRVRTCVCVQSHALVWATADTRHEQKLFMVHGCSHKSMSERKIGRKEEMKRVEKDTTKQRWENQKYEKKKKKKKKHAHTCLMIILKDTTQIIIIKIFNF